MHSYNAIGPVVAIGHIHSYIRSVVSLKCIHDEIGPMVPIGHMHRYTIGSCVSLSGVPYT